MKRYPKIIIGGGASRFHQNGKSVNDQSAFAKNRGNVLLAAKSRRWRKLGGAMDSTRTRSGRQLKHETLTLPRQSSSCDPVGFLSRMCHQRLITGANTDQKFHP